MELEQGRWLIYKSGDIRLHFEDGEKLCLRTRSFKTVQEAKDHAFVPQCKAPKVWVFDPVTFTYTSGDYSLATGAILTALGIEKKFDTVKLAQEWAMAHWHERKELV